MKLSSSHLDKPPLFNPTHCGVGSENIRSVSFGSSFQSNQSANPHPENDFKIPKVEDESFFGTEADMPSFKRPKISDVNSHHQEQQLQMEAQPSADAMDVQLFANTATTLTKLVEDSQRDQNSIFITGFNPLNERPLGLNLRKSPSLVDLIQRKLAQSEEDGPDGQSQGMKGGRGANSDKDKLKAANFPASKLRIGTWECTSRYDGDLVAKCYYAKRKLVWEVLDSSLKSKMEVQWSDISALKAVFPDDQPATLDIELSRPPLFFREINPQPRKHTLWQSTSDFTDGQATICRHHSVQFPVGVLNRHFEKLLQCDARLKSLHEQTRIIVDSCFFDNRNMQMERHHMLQYQSVLSDHPGLQPLGMGALNEDHLPHSVCGIESLQGHLGVQGLQTESLKQITPRHQTIDNVKGGFTLDGIKSDPLQHVVSMHNDIAPLTGVRHRQGGFQLQFSAAAAGSPSSERERDKERGDVDMVANQTFVPVIDTRGESSSSSENEEAPRKENGKCDIRKDMVNMHGLQGSSRSFPNVRSGPSHPVNEWKACLHARDGSSSWEIESAASSPVIQTPEQQALNALSMHLLGEPINATTPNTFPLGRANSQNMHEVLGNASPGARSLSMSYKEPMRDMSPMSYKEPMREMSPKHGNPRNGIMSIGHSKMYSQGRENTSWNSMVENRTLESVSSSVAPSLVASHIPSSLSSRTPHPVMSSSMMMSHGPSMMSQGLSPVMTHGPSMLASHGSYVDLVYLPRIASQPQFLEPGP